jgi:putative membrane protein
MTRPSLARARTAPRYAAAARVALVLGLAVMIFFVVREGGPAILTLLAAAGWVLLWLVPLHALPLALDVLGWRRLLEPSGAPRESAATPSFGALLWIASIREAVNRLLPVANIGGEVVGIRLVAKRGVETARAAASIIVETFLTLLSQYLFVAAGIVLMLRAAGRAQPIGDILLGLAIALFLIAVLFALLRYGAVFERVTRLAGRVLGDWSALGAVAGVDAAIRALFGRKRRLAAVVLWQVAGLVAGVLETWLALRWLRFPVAFGEAVALESLTQAVRHFIFVVPAGLGVQEAGLIGFGALIGVPADIAVTLSLVKRMREIVFGVPALVSWQWMEGRPRPAA